LSAAGAATACNIVGANTHSPVKRLGPETLLASDGHTPCSLRVRRQGMLRYEQQKLTGE
jgi:hypothetical protein